MSEPGAPSAAAWARADARLAELAERHALIPEVPPRLRRLLELLAADPGAPTPITDPARAVDVHVADSLEALALSEVRSARRLSDLGPGAGFPGLALACALPDCRVVLVESASRRCAFLRRAVSATGTGARAVGAGERAGGVEVVHARAEEAVDAAGQADIVTARALAPLGVLCEYAAPLLGPGGRLVAWKGTPGASEIADAHRAAAQLGLEAREVHPAPAHEGAERHTLHVYEKVRPTPARYPRRPGMARKRPL